MCRWNTICTFASKASWCGDVEGVYRKHVESKMENVKLSLNMNNKMDMWNRLLVLRICFCKEICNFRCYKHLIWRSARIYFELAAGERQFFLKVKAFVWWVAVFMVYFPALIKVTLFLLQGCAKSKWLQQTSTNIPAEVIP